MGCQHGASANRPLPGGLGLHSKKKERMVTGGLGQNWLIIGFNVHEYNEQSWFCLFAFSQENSLLWMEAFDKIQTFALNLDCATVGCCSNLPKICKG